MNTLPPTLRVGLLALSTLVSVAAGAAHATDDTMRRQVAARASALTGTADAACTAITRAPNPSPLELEHAIREARDAVGKVVISDETIPAAAPIFARLGQRIGDLDRIPSLQLQMLRNALADKAGDTARLIEGRAFVHALLQRIADSGDGATPATAWHPCLVGNEYVFVQQFLQARVEQQALVHEGGRHYDKLTLTMGDGSTREVFFDITDLYTRNAEALTR